MRGRALIRSAGQPLALAVLLAAVAWGTSAPTAASGAPQSQAPALAIHYLGNEGFFVQAGDDAVLLDALVGDGIPPYVRAPETARRTLASALSPFDGVDVALASHFHADHFDAEQVARFLRAAPGAEFVSTPQAAAQLEAVLGLPAQDSATADIWRRVHAALPAEGRRERIELRDVTVEVLNLHHGRNRNPPVENLGLLVTIGGWRLLHIGDTMASLEEIAANDLREDEIDVAFVPYWRLLDGDGPRLVSDVLGARYVVIMHVPGDDAPADYFGAAGTRDAMVRELRKLYPSAIIPLEPLETSELVKD